MIADKDRFIQMIEEFVEKKIIPKVEEDFTEFRNSLTYKVN